MTRHRLEAERRGCKGETLAAWWLRSSTSVQITIFTLGWLTTTMVLWIWLQYPRGPEHGRLGVQWHKDKE